MQKKAWEKLLWRSLFIVVLGMISVSSFFKPVVAAEVIGGSVADNTSARSVTIWKYQIKDSSELGEHGTGEKEPTTKTPLAGIKFKVQRVQAINGASITDPMTNILGTDYDIDTTYTEQTVTTGADGSAKINLGTGKTNDGIYLFTELEDDRVLGEDQAKAHRAADPFFVYVPQTSRTDLSSLIYDVQVQPKNILESLLKPDKTVEEGKGYSIKAGQPFNWEATTSIPDGLFQVAAKDMIISPIYDKDGNAQAAPNDKLTVSAGDKIFADYFTFTDTISELLAVKSVKMQVRNTDDTAWKDLDFGTDYTVSVNGTNVTTAPATATAGTANKIVVNVVKPTGTEAPTVGMEKIQSYDQVRVVYNSVPDKDFNGTISNHFDVKYQIPGGKPVEKPSDNDPEYFSGGFDILKIGEDTKASLAGAVFHLSLTESDAKNGIFLAENGKTYGASSGKVADAAAAAVADGTTLLTSTSDANGKASFNGLKLDWFTDTDGDGKQDPTTEPTWAEAKINRSYWVVETTSPDGYELLKVPKEVVVTLDTLDTVALEVVNKKESNLPFTGGTGKVLLVVIALGIIGMGTSAIIIDKRRRQ